MYYVFHTIILICSTWMLLSCAQALHSVLDCVLPSLYISAQNMQPASGLLELVMAGSLAYPTFLMIS
jgi:hypothetical protein